MKRCSACATTWTDRLTRGGKRTPFGGPTPPSRTASGGRLAAAESAHYKPFSFFTSREGMNDGGRAHLLDPQARCDGPQPDRQHQRHHREVGPPHRGAEAAAHDPRSGRDV